MDEGRANIDLLFRNGLRDYEVLPPAEVWDNIHPSVGKKTVPFVLKAAAVALICSLSFTAYFLTSTAPVKNDVVSDFYIKMNDPIHIPFAAYTAPHAMIPVQLPGIVQSNQEIILSEDEADIMFSPEDLVTVNDLTIPLIRNNQSFPEYNISKESDVNLTVPDFVPDPDAYNLSPVTSYFQNRWTVSAMVSPTYFSNIGDGSSAMEKKMSSSEHPVISYSGGFSLSYRLNRRVSIQTGLYYASLDRRVDGINSYSGFRRFNDAKGDHVFEVMTTSGPVYSRNSDVYLQETGSADRIVKGYASNTFDPEKSNLRYITSSITQNFSYLQMPVLVRYKFIDKALDVNIIGGVSYDFLLDNEVFATAENIRYNVGTTMGLNTLTFSSSLGMGMEYNFSDKISLNLEPTFRYYLNPFNQPVSMKIHPYSFGIFSGFSYKF
jgi:hypothetical protein